MRRIFPLIFLSFVMAAASLSADVMTVEKFASMKKCGDPQISPDGTRVLFTVTVPDPEGNSNSTHIWIAPIGGGEAEQFTDCKGADLHPRWSPDGRSIAFVSTRGGASQIWIIGTDGGEARRLTDISTGAHDPVWSPDGKSIVFYSFVDPDCPDDDCNAKRKKEREADPVKARVIEHLLYRHWDSWKEGGRNHLFIADVETGKTRDLTAGRNGDFPTYPWGGSGEYCFSPDGGQICCVSKDPEDEAISTNTDLYLIALPGGGISRLTSSEAADESPAFSPDGRFISYRAQSVPGFEADRWRLMLMDRKTGETREVTADFDRWVGDYEWSPDSRKIFLSAGDDGHSALFALDPAGGKMKKLVAKSNNGSIRVSPDGKTLVFERKSFDYPGSIWRMSSDGRGLGRLVDFNAETYKDLEINTAEEVRYTGAEGASIQAFLIKPPKFDPSRKYPAIVIVHGGPQSAFIDSWYTNWNAQTFAAAGYVIFIPNFHGSDGFGQEFVNSISLDWGGRCYEDIMLGVDYLASLPFVDPAKIGAAGASFGGYMINWIEGHTDRFACLISMAGAFNIMSKYGVTEELWFPEWDFGGTPWTNREIYEKWSPHNFVADFKTPCMVVHGELDFRVPVGEGLQMFTALQRMGVPSKLLYFPDEGHWVLKPKNNIFYYEQFIGWMDSYLK